MSKMAKELSDLQEEPDLLDGEDHPEQTKHLIDGHIRRTSGTDPETASELYWKLKGEEYQIYHDH
jgi:hypothetical protein